jgi:putative phosphoribosyl transferase
MIGEEIRIPADEVSLNGDLSIPAGAAGVVLFAHGSGSSRHSPRNRMVADEMNRGGIGTLLFDLLTAEEETVDIYTRHLRFDIAMLARRLGAATRWLIGRSDLGGVKIGYFGASTGGGAALVAAADLGSQVAAVVSRGGRPDLAGPALPRVQAATLLIVGELDEVVIGMNEEALAQLKCEKRLQIIPGATHLFEEPGTLQAVSRSAIDWFKLHFQDKQKAVGG